MSFAGSQYNPGNSFYGDYYPSDQSFYSQSDQGWSSSYPYNDPSQQYFELSETIAGPTVAMPVPAESLSATLSDDTVVSFAGVVQDENTGFTHNVTFFYDLTAEEVLGAQLRLHTHTHSAEIAELSPYAVLIQADLSRTHYFRAALPAGAMYFAINTWIEHTHTHSRRFGYKVWFPIVHPGAFDISFNVSNINNNNSNSTTSDNNKIAQLFFDRSNGKITGACLRRNANQRPRAPSCVASHPHEMMSFFSLPLSPTHTDSESEKLEFAVATKYYDQTVRFEVLYPLPAPMFFDTTLSGVLVRVFYDRDTGCPLEARAAGTERGSGFSLVSLQGEGPDSNVYFTALPPPCQHVQFHLFQKSLSFSVVPL